MFCASVGEVSAIKIIQFTFVQSAKKRMFRGRRNSGGMSFFVVVVAAVVVSTAAYGMFIYIYICIYDTQCEKWQGRRPSKTWGSEDVRSIFSAHRANEAKGHFIALPPKKTPTLYTVITVHKLD